MICSYQFPKVAHDIVKVIDECHQMIKEQCEDN